MRELISRLGGLAFGGDYNPEQWPPTVWREDIALMRDTHVNLVTVGVFSWAMLERAENSFDFTWLDEILGLLHEAGIAVDLATGTASPPPWFFHQYPQARLVDRTGTIRQFGARQAFCPSSPQYRGAAGHLAGELARRYGEHPAVVMWHVNNEYGCHNWECFCETSAAAFRVWLQTRYTDIARLNEAWGTAFWSQRYNSWQEIQPPGLVSYRSFPNPTSQLDWCRFCSDELLACFRVEASRLRAVSAQPVTTNFMSFFKPVDYFAWSTEVDVVSNDDYLITDNQHPEQLLAMTADLMRSLGHGRNWLLMEHSTSAVNWQPRNPAKAPGQMRRNSLQHIARGSEGALFFQWRAAKSGAEKYHSAMLPHAGTNTRRWQEVVSLGRDLHLLKDVAGSTTEAARVAILFDWNSWWAAELDSHPTEDFSVMRQLQRWHHRLWELNIGVDFVHPNADYSSYAVVLIPGLYLMDDDAMRRVREFVNAGGCLLAGYFSGIVDQHDHVRTGGYPGALKDVLGITVEEFNPLMPGQDVHLSEFGIGSLWSETCTAQSAQPLAYYTNGSTAGSVAISHNRFGTGHAFYLGTELIDSALADLIDAVLEQAGLDHSVAVHAGVEIVHRRGLQKRFSFIINHSGQPARVTIPGRNLLGNNSFAASITVDAGAVAVVASDLQPSVPLTREPT